MSNYSLEYLSSDFFAETWEMYGDPLVTQLPLMGDPFVFYGLVAGLVCLVKFVAPQFTPITAKMDLRPAMLITNGLIFGVSGMGFLVGLPLTNMGWDSFTCYSADPRSKDMKIISLKYVGFMYTVIKLMEFSRPLLATLSGKSGQVTSFAYLGYLIGQASVGYLGSIFYPGGYFALWPLTDTFVSTLTLGYLILLIPGDDVFRPRPLIRKVIHVLRYVQFLSLFVQGLYFILFTSCGQPIITAIQIAHNFTLLYVMTSAYVKCNKKATATT